MCSLCMAYRKSSFFLAGFHQNLGIKLVVSSATDRRLLDKQFKAVVACGAIVYLVLSSFPQFKRYKRISQRLPSESNHIDVTLFDILRAIGEKSAIFGADRL